MSMSTDVIGIKPPDETWKKMFKAWKACKEAGSEPPLAVSAFFNDEEPDPSGVLVDLHSSSKFGVKPYCVEGAEGYEVDLTKLPKDIKILRFINSW